MSSCKGEREEQRRWAQPFEFTRSVPLSPLIPKVPCSDRSVGRAGEHREKNLLYEGSGPFVSAAHHSSSHKSTGYSPRIIHPYNLLGALAQPRFRPNLSKRCTASCLPTEADSRFGEAS